MMVHAGATDVSCEGCCISNPSVTASRESRTPGALRVSWRAVTDEVVSDMIPGPTACGGRRGEQAANALGITSSHRQ